MAAEFRVIGLQVEYSARPIGVDRPHPRFSWGYESDKRAQSQSAYRIVVASSPERLANGEAELLWDSGKVVSSSHRDIAYAGLPLRSGQAYYWKVQAWDANGQPTDDSETGEWEMALLDPGDWEAQWIGMADEENTGALPIFRSVFRLDKEVARAKAYICGLGHYELRLNGRKVGDRVLEPGWTNYDKTCLYSVIDATEYVRKGDNAIGVMLGNGFFNVTGGRYSKYVGSFGEPKLIARLEVEYDDGTTAKVVSGDHWRASRGPIAFACMYGGEDYDARLWTPGWDEADFVEDDRWHGTRTVMGPSGKLRAQDLPPLKVMKVFQPVQLNECSPGVYVYDFGQNFSGWIGIDVEGAAGSNVKLTYGELLNADGTVNQTWTKGPSYFSYTLNGEGIETWSPRFSYSGFRYIQVEGAVPANHVPPAAERLPTLRRIEGQMIYPDVSVSGAFACSEPLWNRIHENINWAILSNMKSLLTDCPHREKLGWLEQAHLMGPSIMYNYYVPHLYRKIMDDVAEAQLENGLVPDIAPEYTVFEDGFRDSPEWGSAYIIAGWYAYNWYGDRDMLERHYDGMKKYVVYLTSRSENHLLSHGLGDWCDVGSDGYPLHTPIPVTASAIYYYNAVLMEKITRLLGKSEDERYFLELATSIGQSFNAEFLDENARRYATGSQTSHAMPLALGIVPDALRKQMLANIVRDFQQRGNSPSGGEVGLRFLLKALTEGGQAEIVASLLRKTDHPSYGYQISYGATTLTELWDGPTAGLSQNHFMFGHPEEWFYSSLAGIRIDYEEPRFQRIAITPHPVEGVRWARAHHDLVQGRVSVYWRQEEAGVLQLDVTIPVNTTAVIHVPAASMNDILENGQQIGKVPDVEFIGRLGDRTLIHVGSGEYRFTAYTGDRV
ncbi:alpha-L-rhamnosidase [Cohnella soli]|uniref:alpha-L-rhamnosidase n=1 Tax=Cohnella soli TaxID=425005 RepID=A0ABW0HNH6_9BACL